MTVLSTKSNLKEAAEYYQKINKNNVIPFVFEDILKVWETNFSTEINVDQYWPGKCTLLKRSENNEYKTLQDALEEFQRLQMPATFQKGVYIMALFPGENIYLLDIYKRNIATGGSITTDKGHSSGILIRFSSVNELHDHLLNLFQILEVKEELDFLSVNNFKFNIYHGKNNDSFPEAASTSSSF